MEEYLSKEKENVFYNFTLMIKNSWTYARLTKEEQERIVNVLNDSRTRKEVKGTYNQRWETLNLMYHAFLVALDYKPIGWREEDIPKF